MYFLQGFDVFLARLPFIFCKVLTYFLQDCHVFLNLERAGRRPARAWFLKIDMVRTSVCVCVYVCLSVCVSAPRAIKNYSRERKSE